MNVDDVALYPGATFAIASAVFRVIKIPLVPGSTPLAPLLKNVIQDLCLRNPRLTAQDIDVTNIPVTDVVQGYALKNRVTLRAALEPLMQAYFLDAVETDGVIRWVKRGGTSVATIVTDHLSARSPDSAPPAPVIKTRIEETALLRELNVRFINVDNEYKVGVGLAKRLSGSAEQIRTIDLPIVLAPDHADAIANTLLFNMWNDREPLRITVSRRYLKYTPTDLVTLNHPELGSLTTRITKMEYHFPQLIVMECTPEDPSIYQGFTFPAPVTLEKQPVYPSVANLQLFVLDIPVLRDVDNHPGLYLGAYAISGEYQPGEVYRSPDAVTFDPIIGLETAATVGSANTTLSWDGSFQ